MLGWLRDLLNGDQASVPPGADVTRDAQGRVVRVEQVLGSPARPVDGVLPDLAIDADTDDLLSEAWAWLRGRNRMLAEQHGIGSETSFLFDQDEGSLTLRFEDGRRVVAAAQVLGSFDPADRSILWGWDNASLRPALVAEVATLRDRGARETAFRPFAAGRSRVAFDDLTLLLALAAHAGGSDGVYRCVGDRLSLFLSIRLPDDRSGQAGPDGAEQDEAVAVVDAYDAAMLGFDQAYARRDGDGSDDVDRHLAGKIEVYRRYWTRDDDYWLPCSLGWPSDHDPALQDERFVIRYGGPDLLCVTIADTSVQTAYHLRRINGALRIVDQRIGWGGGLVWPVAVDRK